MWLAAGNGFSDPSEHLHIPWLTPHNDHKRNSLLKKIRFLCFSPKMACKAIFGENHKNRIIFKGKFLLMWSLWGVNHGTCRCSEGSEKPFPAPITFPATPWESLPWNWPWCKMPKNAKITIWAKNSNFEKTAGSVRKCDIWPEMGFWGVLALFCTRNRYLNSFRSIFKQF